MPGTVYYVKECPCRESCAPDQKTHWTERKIWSTNEEKVWLAVAKHLTNSGYHYKGDRQMYTMKRAIEICENFQFPSYEESDDDAEPGLDQGQALKSKAAGTRAPKAATKPKAKVRSVPTAAKSEPAAAPQRQLAKRARVEETESDMPVPDTYHEDADESRVVATDLTPACSPDDVFMFKRSQLHAMAESTRRAERALLAASRMAQAAADCFKDEAHVAHDVKTTIDAVLSLR